MTRLRNDLKEMLWETSKIQIYIYIPTPSKLKQTQAVSIPLMFFPEWTGLWILICMCTLLDFPNCYGNFLTRTTKQKHLTQNSGMKSYLFQQANGNVSVQGPFVGFIQHDGTKEQRKALSGRMTSPPTSCHWDHPKDFQVCNSHVATWHQQYTQVALLWQWENS